MVQTNLKLTRRRAALAALWLVPLLALLSAGQASRAAAQPPAHPAAPFAPTQLWRTCPSPPGYCETGWYASPAVADINHDGVADVIWGGYTLMAVNGANGHIEWNQPATNHRLWPSIAVADLFGNGLLEVITGQSGGYVSVYDSAGHFLPGWPQQPDAGEIRSLAVADLDGDGRQEIIVATTNSPNTGGKHWWVYEPDGAIRPGWPRLQPGDLGYAAGAYNENIGVADLNGDGKAEIIGPSDVHYITAYHNDGSQIAVNPMFTGRQFWSQVGVHVLQSVDIRGYANCDAGELRPNFANSAPVLSDLLGNSSVQVVVVGNVYNCSGNYTDLYEMPFIFNADRSRWVAGGFNWTDIPVPDGAAAPLSEDYNLIENSLPNPVTADLDGDGKKEILYASYDGRLHAYWLDKTEHGHWPFVLSSQASPYFEFASEPVVADLDHDGKAEVIFTTWTQHTSNQPGHLYILSWDGLLLNSIELPRDPGSDYGGALAAPTLAHLDNDPNLDVVVGTVDMGLVAYRLAGTAGTQLLWPTGRANLGRTGASLGGNLSASLKSVMPLLAQPGGALTYTLRLLNPGPLLPSARLTDTLPANATLLTGTLAASSGTLAVAAGRLTWHGPVSASVPITITYVMTTSAGLNLPTAILNTAQIDDGLGRVLVRQVAAFVHGLQLLLPLLRR
jgi:uncharacterized repeat protein (TIGR01451 family)